MQKNHANDFSKSVSIYIKELSDIKFKPVPIEIERQLISDAQRGDEKATKQLIETHLRLVVNIVKKYKGYGLSMSDLIQEGNIGLYEAIKRYKPLKEIRFSFYAEWWVKKYVKFALSERKVIKNNELEIIDDNNDNDEKNENSEIFYEAEIQGKGYQDCDEDYHEREKNYSEVIEDLLSNLDDRTRLVIEYSYGLKNKETLSMVDISKILNISAERVRQIRAKGMTVLRANALVQSLSLEEINN